MNKVIFENGIKEKNASVTINNVDYQVSPEVWSGKTPISAENLNKIQDNAEKAILTLESRIENIEEDVSNIDNTAGHIYGIRRKITNNSNSAWERIYDSVGLVANATHNGGTVQNDFDNLAPWKEIKTYNRDPDTGKIKAWFGDATFKFDGSNGDVFTYFPETYIKVFQENDYDYILISDVSRSGFKHYDEFSLGRYRASLVDGKLRTYSGLKPEQTSLDNARPLAKALGNGAQIMDWRFIILQILYLVEYADYNSQDKLGNGVCNGQDVISLIAETGTNRIVISSDLKGLYVGREVAIGTNYWNTSIANERIITKIEDYTNSDNGITGKSITFDGDPVDIAVGSHIWGICQPGGQCDSLGMKSGCRINDNYHSVIYRGVEDPFGNQWQWLDGILLQNDKVYICKDPSKYNSKDYSEYKELAYILYHGGGWAAELGYDTDEPLVRIPVAVKGNDRTYMCDCFYNNSGTEIYAPLVGGYFNDGAITGFFCWYMTNRPSSSSVTIGCRLLISNQ